MANTSKKVKDMLDGLLWPDKVMIELYSAPMKRGQIIDFCGTLDAPFRMRPAIKHNLVVLNEDEYSLSKNGIAHVEAILGMRSKQLSRQFVNDTPPIAWPV